MFTQNETTGLNRASGKGCNLKKYTILNNLRKLKTAATVAAVIGIATGVFPAIAQAQLVRRTPQTQPILLSGDPNQEANVRLIEFSLDPSVADTNPDPNVGEFPGAIQNFRIDSNNDNLDLFLPSGDLRTSKLTTDPTTGNFPGLNFGYEAFIEYTTSRSDFNNDGLRYDVTFPGRTETLTLFIPSNDPNDDRLINSLSGLNDFLISNQIQAVVSRPDVPPPENVARIVASNPDPNRRALNFRFATVPEPTATASLLGVGALGAVALLKRNKR